MQKFSLALIGAGRIGAFHARALAHSDAVEITRVVEPREQLPAALSNDSVAHLRSVDELIAQGEIGGALVAAPTRHHASLVTALLAAGIPVLCEKPVGLTSATAREVQIEAERIGGILRVAFWRRFVPDLVEVRERARRGGFGEISFVYSSQWDEVPPAAAFRDVDVSGGIIVDCGVHDFDLLRWLLGEEITAASGYASLASYGEPVPGDQETVHLALQLSSGAAAGVTLGRRHPPGELQTLHLVGTEGSCYLQYVDASDAPVVLDCFRRLVEDFAQHVQVGAVTSTGSLSDAIRALEAAELAKTALGDGDRAPAP